MVQWVGHVERCAQASASGKAVAVVVKHCIAPQQRGCGGVDLQVRGANRLAGHQGCLGEHARHIGQQQQNAVKLGRRNLHAALHGL